jgi:5'-nucleotidase
MMALITKYANVAMPFAGAVIGSITADMTRTANAAGESALGAVVADSQLYDTAAPDRGGAVIAFMNPGGLRAELLYAPVYYQEGPGEITYGEAFAVQPFSNNLVTMDLQGVYIHDLLEQQWTGGNSGINAKVLQVSHGLTYQWSASAAPGDRVDPASIMLNGVPIDPNATYRVTANIFLAGGGDNFAAFKQGTNWLVGGMDLDAMISYFGAHSPVPPGPQNRIVVLP